MGKKRLNLFISLLIGLIIFCFFLYKVGLESIFLIFRNMKLHYLFSYLIVTTLTFFPTVLRWKILLKTYGKKVPFWSLSRYIIAGYAVGYVTPSVKLGGEPVKAYMLKKEHNIDLKTGSSSIIIDKFIELTGMAFFGLIGLFLFLFLPQLSFLFKFIFVSVILFAFYMLFLFYYRTIKGKGSFSSLFVSLRLYKIFKLKNFVQTLQDVEKKIGSFFLEHKKEFLFAFLTCLLYGVLVIFEFKFLLLALGVNGSLKMIILALVVWGAANLVPVPGALGFLEAGQTGLFSLLKEDGSIGFALSLLIRVRALLFVAIGFSFISHFSGKHIGKFYKKNIPDF